jgi:hypothetical protein
MKYNGSPFWNTQELPQSKKEIKLLNFYRFSTPYTDIRPAKHEAISEKWVEASLNIYLSSKKPEIKETRFKYIYKHHVVHN